jgi:hypothetical protein
MAPRKVPGPIKPTPSKTSTTTRNIPSGSIAQPRPTTPKTPFDPKSLTKSNQQIVQTIQQRNITGRTDKDTGKGTGTGAGTGGIKPLTFTDTDNGDGTITRRYSDGTVEIVAGGRGPGQTTDPATAELLRRDEANRVSAFKILEDTFNSYGLGSLAANVRTFMEQGLSDDEAVIQLRQTPEYKQRFLGNEGRRAKGLFAYSEAEYLQAEQTYRDLLAQSGLETLASADTFSKLIGGAVSPAETQDRIQNVFNKIDNADPQLREQIGGYLTGYGIGDPNIQRTQLASALLMGGTSAQDLVRNIEKAQIKTAALTSGMTLAEENISSLQKQLETAKTYDVYGTSKKAFGELAQTMPTTEKLANIYGEDTSNLSSELQQEAFFGLQSQRRKRLQQREQATFGGQAGTSTVSLAQQSTGAI